jgi:hypothetical protein
VSFPYRDSRGSNILHLETDSHAFAHLIFALSFGLCAYNFFRAMTLDPGTCPTPKSDAELKSVRDSALRAGITLQCYVFL